MRNLLLISLLGVALMPALVHAEEPACDRSGSKTTPSPDGQWVANVQEEVCATPNGAAAGITVVIVSAQDPAHSQRVFIMPVPRSRDDWPHIRWDSPTAMQIRVPNLSQPTAPNPEFAGIHISMAYCGDNPDDRAKAAAYKAAVQQWQKDVSAWAGRRKQDADAAGPRPPRPEEPALAFGRCID
ncbi:MAG: hypothetical protein ABI616_01455 [Pseudomonadota bacterium]